MRSPRSRKPTSIARQGRGGTAAARYYAGSTGYAAAALYERSLDYLNGRGVKQDDGTAFELNFRAAALGDHDAVLAMGWFYNHGIGVEKDDDEAFRWYRESARHGEARAMFSLGAIAFERAEFEEALPWFRRAAEAEHSHSLYWLGKMYWRGAGVLKDRKAAMQLFQRAAAAKIPAARRFLRLFPRLRAQARARK
jgi:TPR repeat protein